MNLKIGNDKRLTFVCIFAVLLVLGLIVNTVNFQKKVNDLEESLMVNSNQQLAKNIEFELRANKEFLEGLAETIKKKPNMLLTDRFLEKKAESISINEIFILSEKNGVINWVGNAQPYLSLLDNRSDIWKTDSVFIGENNNIIYTIPMYSENGLKVIVGIENYDCVHNMIDKMDGWNKAVHLVANKNGEALIVKRDNGANFEASEISMILDIAKESGFSTVINKNGYTISSAEVNDTGWIQISAEISSTTFDIFTKNINNFFFLITIETIFFGMILALANKDMRRKERLLMIDHLTGGYNRSGFIKEAMEYIKSLSYDNYYVVCFNICDFRIINEMWGDNTGNSILQLVHNKISKNLKEDEIVARDSMDNFIVLMNAENDNEINARVQEIIKKINFSFKFKFMGEELKFSVGACSIAMENKIAIAISKGQYVGKVSSKYDECYFYDEEIAKKMNEEIEINNLFEKSIENNDFVVYLQPKVSSNKKYTAEALVRWIHPEKGIIYPNRFIPVLEKNGKINILDKYVFEEVCKIISDWMKKTGKAIEISVNLSRFTIKEESEDIWDFYKSIKDKYNIPDGLIEIELTETIMIDGEHIDYVKKVVDGLRRNGLKVSLDDFGFAYSSLSVLKELDVDTIKLDRLFFSDESEKSRIIVQNVINLAHNLNTTVVAEGIEDSDQVDYLWECGCDYIQGYIYSKPLTIKNFENWVIDMIKRGD